LNDVVGDFMAANDSMVMNNLVRIFDGMERMMASECTF